MFPATVFATLPFCFLKLGERGSKLPFVGPGGHIRSGKEKQTGYSKGWSGVEIEEQEEMVVCGTWDRMRSL